MNKIDPLLPDAGTDFFGIIEGTPEGTWRAVATSRKSGGKRKTQIIAIETFLSEQAAYDWLKNEAVARQFCNIEITIRIGAR
jgi:hypothetical protein